MFRKSFFWAGILLYCMAYPQYGPGFFAFNIYPVAADGSVKAPLERTNAELLPVPVKSGGAVYVITGMKSSRRMNAAEILFHAAPDFSSIRADPSTEIFLYKLEATKNSRMFSLHPTGRVQSQQVAVSFQEEDHGSSYKIVLTGTLGPGEYAFIDKTTSAPGGNVTVFAFGID